MLLAINANNTNTSFAMWEGAELKGSWRIATNGRRTADEYVVWLDHLLLLEELSRSAVDGVVIGSVVPDANFNLLTFSRRYCRTVAAHDRYKGPLIVIDFGTATTFDVVDADGNYVGGVIAPGINLSLTALHMAAAKLPSVRISRTERVIGTDTVSCMQSGIYWGYMGLVEGLVGRFDCRR